MKNSTCRLSWTMILLALTASQSQAQAIYESYTFTTLAGLARAAGSADGTGSTARFRNPFGVVVDRDGNVFVADSGNHTIRKVTPEGVVNTLAGLSQDTDGDGNPDWGNKDGIGSAARFAVPIGVAVDSAGNVYVADEISSTIRRISPTREVTTLAGGGPRRADETATLHVPLTSATRPGRRV